jgi:hypothetical protein
MKEVGDIRHQDNGISREDLCLANVPRLVIHTDKESIVLGIGLRIV